MSYGKAVKDTVLIVIDYEMIPPNDFSNRFFVVFCEFLVFKYFKSIFLLFQVRQNVWR